MIAGRPVNLILGAFTATFNAVVLALASQGITLDGALVAAINAAAAALITLIAGQPPTLSPGDTFKIQTPSGAPNTTGVVTPPPPVTVSSTPAADVVLEPKDGGS